MDKISCLLVLCCVLAAANAGFLFRRDDDPSSPGPAQVDDSTTAASVTGTNAVVTTAQVGDPNCKDKLDCLSYGHPSCTGPYEDWAHANCQAFCGFCIPITTPFICEDKIPNCDQYGDICNDPQYITFAEKKCVKYCKLCPGDLTSPAPKTGCYDDFERCDEFGKTTCTKYPDWSKLYCAKYCDICESNETDSTAPTAPVTTTVATTHGGDPCYDRQDCSSYDITTSCCGQYEAFSRYNCAKHCKFCEPLNPPKRVCTDNIPNCDQYGADLCTNTQYEHFVNENCNATCKVCDQEPYVPPCATHAPDVSTTPPPEKKCVSEGREYSKGDKWYTFGCAQQCECVDPDNNQIKCGPLECPQPQKDCDLVYVIGGCCPVLKCSFVNTIHGEMTQEWEKIWKP